MTPGEAFRFYDLTSGHVVITFGGVLLYQGRVEDTRMRVNAVDDGEPVSWTARPAPTNRR